MALYTMGEDPYISGRHGKDELLRIQNGGCPTGGCTGAPYALPGGRTTNRYPGANFQ
jgi:hypothetical protein